MTHHNQTKVLTTWFVNLPLDESIDNKTHEVWILNPRHNEEQLQDQKPIKAQEGHLEEGKIATPIKGMKSSQPSKMVKKS
jgi:hypothetical protein